MKKILRWVVVIPVGALIVLFLIANRKLVALSLDPFSTDAPAIATPALPLWIWLILALFVGFFMGAAGMWVSDRELRIRAKTDRLELKALKKAMADAEAAPSEPIHVSE
jgi:uncharacterized protein YneF (UPF0154 family)